MNKSINENKKNIYVYIHTNKDATTKYKEYS